MSKILNDITTDSISLSECLQRLLVIANKTDNKELADWCSKELNGYKNITDLPDYRKFKSTRILYSGINGRFQVTNQPMQPGYLSAKTIKELEDINLFENIVDVEKRKDLDEVFSRDLTFLASEVYKNTKDEYLGIGVQCTSITQPIPQQFYTEIFTAVKTRIINLLCSFEKMNIDLDNLDINIKRNSTIENEKIFNQIIVEGNTYSPNKKEKKILWNILIPIIKQFVIVICFMKHSNEDNVNGKITDEHIKESRRNQTIKISGVHSGSLSL